jgi:putative membrane protein
MRSQLLAATIVAGTLVVPALATAQEATGTGAAAPAATEMQQADMEFATKAAAAGKAEVELAKLGTEKATDPEVKTFADRLVQDHATANDQLAQIMQTKNMEMPAEGSAEAKAEHDRIVALSGSEFDREFMKHWVTSHEKGIELYSAEAESGQDPELKQFAADTLPTLREHLDEATRIESGLQQVAGSAAPEQQTEPASGGTTAEPPTTSAEDVTDDPTATQEAARPVYPLGEKTANDLIGQTVVNQNGEDIGDVADIVLNAGDQAVLAVLSVGGFLGLGEKNVTVPFEQLQPGENGSVLMSSATEEDLKALPDYDENAGYTAVPRDQPIGQGIQ